MLEGLLVFIDAGPPLCHELVAAHLLPLSPLALLLLSLPAVVLVVLVAVACKIQNVSTCS